jgi:polysaccharide biosynthesis protein PslG
MGFEMHRAHRAAALALVLLLALTMLAACGGGDDDPTATVAVTAATATPAAQAGTPTADAASPTSADATATQPAATAPAQTATQAVPQATATETQAPEATATATEEPATTPTVRASTVDHRQSPFAYGWNVGLRGDDNGAEHNTQTFQMVDDSGFGWIRFQLEWSQFERTPGGWDPLPMDRMIGQAHDAGLQILIVVTKAPEWALDPNGQQFLADWGTFENFMRFVSERYRGQVQAWEVWNEQNLAHEMHGHVRVSDYIELLRAGHDGIRAGDPNALIVFGGLTPNGVNDPSIAIDDLLYLQEIYAWENGRITEYFDILGVHLNSTHNPPDTMWPDNPSNQEGWNEDPSFYFRRAEQLRLVQLQYNDDATPMWITEFGWTTENQAPGYEYGVNNSEQDVANYLVRSLQISRQVWDFVTGAFVWNLNWSTLANPEDEIYPWSALNGDWTPRPAYEALRDMPKR